MSIWTTESWRFNTTAPALLWVDSDTFQCGQVLTYQARNGDMFVIPFVHRSGRVLSFLTDLGSKPLWSSPFVGDRCDELTLAYIHHDGLFVFQRVLRAGQWVRIDFDYTQRALAEMMDVLGVSNAKSDTILAAVAVGGRGIFNANRAFDENEITVENPSEDFRVLTVKVTPNFDTEEAA